MYQVQKKRRGIWWILALFLCAFIVGLGIGIAGIKQGTKTKEPEPVRAQSKELILPMETESEIPEQVASVILEAEETITPPEETFYVTVQGNKVSVFTIDKEGHRKFSHNLDIELDALRAEDKQLFYEGITLYTKEELSSLIEDFGS